MRPIVLCAVLLSGCSYLAPVVQRGSKAYDAVAEGSEYTLCEALSVAAVMRRYPAGTPQGDGWWAMCKSHYQGVTPPWAELPATQ